MRKIEAVIFDWAGTTVDYGCFAPVQAFLDAFVNYGLHPTFDEIRRPMGMLKIDHIKTMLEMETLNGEFQRVYHREFQEEDVQKIYAMFEKALMEGITKHTEVKPYVTETVAALRRRGIKIGSTTGYTDRMMEPVLAGAAKQGYAPDCWFSPDSTGHMGRPYPYMIFRNMMELKISGTAAAIKVGDTVSDIREGINAGLYSVGVIEGSSLLGLSQAEYLALDADAREAAIQRTKQTYLENGADAVILNLSELEALVDELEA